MQDDTCVTETTTTSDFNGTTNTNMTETPRTFPFKPKQSFSTQPFEKLTLDIIRKLPKADLHRHLDGSVRISTIIELAKQQVW